MNLKCTDWDHKNGTYKFCDPEDGSMYSLTTQKVAETLPVFFSGLGSKWHFDHITPLVSDDEDDEELMEDLLCDADAEDVDAIIQIALFGKILFS